MDGSYVDLPGSEVEYIRVDGPRVELRFSRAYIIQTQQGATQSTRWYQSGSLIFEGAELTAEAPTGPLVCEGGDVGENVYTYRDMVPIPLASRGLAHCDLRFRDTGQHLQLRAEAVTLEMEDRPYYIEHIPA